MNVPRQQVLFYLLVVVCVYVVKVKVSKKILTRDLSATRGRKVETLHHIPYE
jgi:hypothetical protein